MSIFLFKIFKSIENTMKKRNLIVSESLLFIFLTLKKYVILLL